MPRTATANGACRDTSGSCRAARDAACLRRSRRRTVRLGAAVDAAGLRCAGCERLFRKSLPAVAVSRTRQRRSPIIDDASCRVDSGVRGGLRRHYYAFEYAWSEKVHLQPHQGFQIHHDNGELSALAPLTDLPPTRPILHPKRRSVGYFTYPCIAQMQHCAITQTGHGRIVRGIEQRSLICSDRTSPTPTSQSISRSP